MGNKNSIIEKYYDLDDEKNAELLKNNLNIVVEIIKYQNINILVDFSKKYKIKTINFIIEEIKKEIVYYNNKNTIIHNCISKFIIYSLLDVLQYTEKNNDKYRTYFENIILNITLILKYINKICCIGNHDNNIGTILKYLLHCVMWIYNDDNNTKNYEIYMYSILEYNVCSTYNNKILNRLSLIKYFEYINNKNMLNILFDKYVKQYNIKSIKNCLELILENENFYEIIINYNFEDNKENNNCKNENLAKIKNVANENIYLFHKSLKYNNLDILKLFDLDHNYFKNEIKKNIIDKEQFIKKINEMNII